MFFQRKLENFKSTLPKNISRIFPKKESLKGALMAPINPFTWSNGFLN